MSLFGNILTSSLAGPTTEVQTSPAYQIGWQTPAAGVFSQQVLGAAPREAWKNWLGRYTAPNGTITDPLFQKYYDVASGNIPQDFKFESLLSGQDKAISPEEFYALPPDVQAVAKANPQLFLQSVMTNTANQGGSGDLMSLGAEGGYGDYSTATWNPQTGLTPDPSKYMSVTEEPNWALYAGLAALGGAAAYGGGLLGGAGAGAGEAAASSSFIPSTATSGMLGAGSGLTSGTAFTGMGSMLSPELAAVMGSGAITPSSLGLMAGGGGIMTAAGGAAFDAAMAQGLGYDAAMQAAISAGGEVGTGGAGLFSNLQDAYNAYSKGSKVYNALTGGQPQQGVTGGSMATDWGSLLGGAGNLFTQNYLLGQGVDRAAELAKDIKFTPYAISSDIGRTYQDPTTGEMISKLDPRFAEQQQAMLGAVGSNLAAAQADPMLAAQDAYQKMRALSAFPEEQQRLEMENRLMQQGMLGSTGGANQTRAMQEAMNTANINQQLQSIGLGQTLAGNAMNRATQAWTGAMQPTSAMANQVGQSATLGGQAMSGATAGANLLNNAYLAQLKGQSVGATGMFGSPAISGTGGLINTGVNTIGNWLGGNISNIGSTVGGWLGGSTPAMTEQATMLNDQWDWSW